MKKIILGLLTLSIVSITNAQTGLGIQAGVNFSNVAGKDVQGAKLKTGLQAGVNYNISVADQFVVQPGLNYIQNGFKSNTFFDNDSSLTVKLNLPYLQLPVLFQFRPEFVDGSKMILGVGPYVAYGIGKVKVSADNQSETADWGDLEDESNGGINRFDAGAKMVIGYEMNNGLCLNLNGDLGLTKFVDDAKARTVAFGVTFGYRFK